MINNFSLENYLSFKKANIEFKKGLIVFSGASGSGKSILMNSILDVFSLNPTDAKNIQAIIDINLNLEDYGIEKEDEFYFKKQKNEKTRYFINSQLIPKKKVEEISKKFIKYLHLKDYSDFENVKLIELLDLITSKKNKKHTQLLEKLKTTYQSKKDLEKQLNKILEEEKNIEELKEFTEFEINKIKLIDPKVEEEEELFKIKQRMSKQDNIKERLKICEGFFELENEVFKLLDVLGKDETFLSTAMEELKDIIESEKDSLEDLQNYDIEEILTKIEDYSSLKRKYGSIQNALDYLLEKEKELEGYKNITSKKSDLAKQVKEINKLYEELVELISKNRNENLPDFKREITKFLKLLYIDNFSINLEELETRTKEGKDRLSITLNNTTLNKISTGEFNRLRLALLALQTEYSEDTGILMLDEIDSNLSGEESMSIAKVLKILSKKYQIFAISHLPQLTSSADQHFLVYKEGKESKIKEINQEDRVKEIARLISGKEITKEAMSFAEKFIIENNV